MLTNSVDISFIMETLKTRLTEIYGEKKSCHSVTCSKRFQNTEILISFCICRSKRAWFCTNIRTAKICESENAIKQYNNLLFGIWLFFLLILDRFRVKKWKPICSKFHRFHTGGQSIFLGKMYGLLYVSCIEPSLKKNQTFHIKPCEWNGNRIGKTVEYTEKNIPSMAVYLPQNCRF